MYWAGWTQAQLWKDFKPEGVLSYPNFLETVTQLIPMYLMRAIGGTLYLAGVFVMVYNLMKTAAQGKFMANEEAEAPALEREVMVHSKEHWHRKIERRPVQMLVLSLVLVAIGGIIEIVPTMIVESNIPTIAAVKPYSPLELEGRDIYIREGCYNCHSQMIRPFRGETARYGEYSKAGEFVYDHPFLWGSKRTGPDLAREGSDKLRKSNAWHYFHMLDPQEVSPGSIMPAYPWLFEDELDVSLIEKKIAAMRTLGVPYPENYESIALEDLNKQAQQITDDLAKEKLEVAPNMEIIALIAYLQKLGRDIDAQDNAPSQTANAQ
jgi:cytochrome c oxidase cbb3-type subunit I/II